MSHSFRFIALTIFLFVATNIVGCHQPPRTVSNDTRCIFSITGAPPLSEDQNCLQTFDAIDLVNLNDYPAQQSVLHFQSLHTSWFQKQKARGFNESELKRNNRAYYKVENSAAFLTLAVLSENLSFKSIFNSNTEYSVKTKSKGRKRQLMSIDSIDTNTLSKDLGKFKQSKLHSKGGLLSSASYLFLNLDGELDFVADGVWYSHRLFAKSILFDFLCAETLASVSLNNVSHFVNTAHELPYMHNEKCISCHTSLEPLAATARNFHFKKTQFNNQPIIAIRSFPYQNSDSSVWPAPPEENYSTTLPKGALQYQANAMPPQKHTFTGMKGLANSLKNNKDVYRCFVQRYFKYFEETGGRSDYKPLIPEYANKLKNSPTAKSVLREILAFSFDLK